MSEFKIVYDYFPVEVNEDGVVRNGRTGHVYKAHDDKDGYKTISTTIDGKDVHMRVHRLVALAFHPNPDNLPVVNHKDGVKWNNHKDNVEWCTYKQNTRHAYYTGLIRVRYGEECGSSKYPESTVRTVCELLVEGWRGVDIAKKLDIHQGFVSDLKNKKSWVAVSDEYWTGKMTQGSIKEPVVRQICQMLQDGYRVIDVHATINSKNVTLAKIKHIRSRVTYKEISKEYTWKQNASKHRPGCAGVGSEVIPKGSKPQAIGG